MTDRPMSPEDLTALIAVGEGPVVEFKRSGTTHLGREICAFANTMGGRILIGVDDGGGLHPVRSLNILQSDVQSIARNLDPPLMVACEEVSGVLVVTVPESRHKPHSTAGKFYLREGASCQQMNRDEIREFFYREGLVYFDEKTNDRFRWPDDFAKDAFDAFLEISRITPALKPDVILKNLGLFKRGKMSYAGSLLFSRQGSLFVPGASVNCCLFQGNSTTRILDQKIFDTDLFSNYRSAVTYLLAHLNTAYHIGMDRKEQLEIPEGALREALINALAHRDYRKPGDLQVHIFQDRVEIVNPGGLVGGMTLEKLGNTSLPRNPLLFGMMHRMGLVEKIGSGLTRMSDMCRDLKAPAPEIQADPDWFRIVFQRPADESLDETSEKASGKIQKNVGKDPKKRRERSKKTSGKIQKNVGKDPKKRRERIGKTSGMILDACRENNAITIPELAGRIGITERSIQRSIEKLQAQGLLRREGGRKQGRWEVSE